MTESKRTPGPWQVVASRGDKGRIAICTRNEAPIQAVIADINKKSVAVDHASQLLNAAYIVRACNAHDELVKALERIRREMGVVGFIDKDKIMGWVCTALAKAEK